MIESFKHAFRGITWTFLHGLNFKIHLLISLVVFIFAYLFKVTSGDLIILIFCVILGLTVEMINTSVEELSDLITVKWAKQARIAKDVAAGCMLITSIGLAIIGLVIFIPYL